VTEPPPEPATTDAPPDQPSRRTDAVALGAPVTGLAGLAIASPLLDLFGQNPAYFLTQGFTNAQVLAFAMVIGIAIPLGFGALPVLASTLAGRRVGETVRAVLLVGLGTLLGAELLGKTSLLAVGVAVGAVGVGVAVVLAHERWRGVRSAMRVLALAPFAFVALFVFASPTTELLTASNDVAFADVATEANVVVLVFDEFPLNALLDQDGDLDAERFPNLARLAGTSDWFTNVTSPSWTTTQAVPAILTGTAVPKRTTLPTVSGYPRNLFTLLGGTRQTVAIEPVTSMCPTEVCADVEGAPAPTASLATTATDAAILLAQMAVPNGWAGGLPDTDHSWGGFLDDDVSVDPVDVVADATEPIPEGTDGLSKWRDSGMSTGLDQARVLDSFIQRLAAADGPTLSFAHVVLPHRPWVVTPDGFVYAEREWNPGLTDNVWDDDEAGTLGLQRQALQIQHVDHLIGTLIDRLEDEGIWDDTLLVITSDHGAAFLSGEERREPVDEDLGEIFWVPLFIKAPGQSKGEHVTAPGTLLDVLPTIVDLLDVDPGWSFDGSSLVAERPPCATRRAQGKSIAFELPCDDGPAAEARARNLPRRALDVSAVTPGPSVAAALRFTPDPEAVAALGAVDRNTGRLPIGLTFTIDIDDPAAIDGPFYVTVNGVPAAAVPGPFAAGTDERVVLLDEDTLVEGANTLDLVAG